MKPLSRTLGAAFAALLSTPALAQPSPTSPEVDAEDAFFADEPDAAAGEGDGAPAPAPLPAGMGALVGTVEDASGMPAVQAQVQVVGTAVEAFTSLDGQFRLAVPPGTYVLRILYPLHEVTVLTGVVVAAGEQVAVTERLSAQTGVVLDPIEVEVAADLASVEGQLLTRKRATVVGDSVGRAEMGKTPDRHAAAAMQRVVGVLIVDDKFVYVRGIGERYTNALLDGSPLPSPSPEQQTVPLDLFPTHVLDSLTVVKTFRPDMPGNFAGGSVQIGTRRLPEAFTVSVSGSFGINTQTTFTRMLQSRGSSTDWLGFDDGSRALPEEIPSYQVGRFRKPDGSFQSNDEIAAAGRALHSPMATQRILAPVDHNLSLSVGNTFDLGDDDALGVQLSAGYRRTFRRRTDEQLRTADPLPDGRLLFRNDYRGERGVDTVQWNALGSASLRLGAHHAIHLTGLYSVSADDTAFEIEGPDRERNDHLVHESRLTYEQRQLAFGQLRGEHTLEDLGGASLGWNLSVARAARDQPDTRATVFQFDPAFGYAFEDDSQSGFHFFSELEELTFGGGVDWTQPLARAEDAPALKLGSRIDVRRRTFAARRFSFEPQGRESTFVCPGFPYDEGCPDRIFQPERIGPQDGLASHLQVGEDTLPTDAYDADYDVYAGYAMTDVHLAEGLRVVAGARLEVGRQTIRTFAPYAPDEERFHDEGGTRGEDLMPSVSVVYEVLDGMNLRLAASRTVARPQLREIAPFVFTNYFGGYQEQGNPDLTFTHVWNGDLRWELFPSLREVLAASVFAKRFEAPIEQVIVPNGSRGLVTYQNSPGANLIGGELEARKHLGFVADALEDLSVVANVTVAFSEVELDDASFNTNPVRPMVNQAPWIVNAALDYDDDDLGLRLRLLYNVFGSRIVQVGAGGLPDVYLHPRHQLDLTVAKEAFDGFELTGSAKNLLDDDFRATFGKRDADESLQRRFRTGVTFSLGARYGF